MVMLEQDRLKDKAVQIVVGRDLEDTKKYGTQGTIEIGRHIVGSGEDAHFTTPVLMDVLRPHLIVLSGKRGSGKSFSLGVFVEELMKLSDEYRSKLCSLIIDTQGIFWTMKQPNEKMVVLLNDMGLKPKGFDVKVYVPEGQKELFEKSGVNFDGAFSVSADELAAEDWLAVFDLDPNKSLGIVLQKVISKIRQQTKKYSINHIISEISKEEGFSSEKIALENMLEVAKSWGIFGESKMPDILIGGNSTILDVSLTPQNVRSLMVSLVSKKILRERIIARRKEEMAETEGIYVKRVPMCWIFIDEAHNFISAEGKPASQDILLRITKEGRQPGISLVLATQRPEKLHPDSLAQADLLISHMLTSKADIDSLRAVMQTYIQFDITKYFTDLPKRKGVGIVMDDNSERIYNIYVRPRQSWHAGASPVAKV